MPIDVTAQTEIEADAADVAAFAFDPSHDPIWIGGISHAELITPPPVALSTRVRRTAKFLGKQIDYVLEVVSLTPNREMVMSSVEGPFPMRVTYRFQPIGPRRTLAQIRVEGTATKFYGIGDLLMAPMVRRNIRRDVRGLKKIMEGVRG